MAKFLFKNIETIFSSIFCFFKISTDFHHWMCSDSSEQHAFATLKMPTCVYILKLPDTTEGRISITGDLRKFLKNVYTIHIHLKKDSIYLYIYIYIPYITPLKKKTTRTTMNKHSPDGWCRMLAAWRFQLRVRPIRLGNGAGPRDATDVASLTPIAQIGKDDLARFSSLKLLATFKVSLKEKISIHKNTGSKKKDMPEQVNKVGDLPAESRDAWTFLRSARSPSDARSSASSIKKSPTTLSLYSIACICTSACCVWRV